MNNFPYKSISSLSLYLYIIFTIYLFLGNKNLNDSHIEVLVLDIGDINNHEIALKHVISKFGKVCTL